MNHAEILTLKQISKKFSNHSVPVVADVSLGLQQGEILGLLGPSGCGKTTLLRMIAGFESPTNGTIAIAGVEVSGKPPVPPEKRHTGMVFQDYALFPHLTVADNIAFGLKHQKNLTARAIKQRVAEVLLLVGLSGYERRYPHELSGGQQQRIALARAIAPEPSLILLDEPLSNLDVQVRQYLRNEVRRILKAANISAVFVTHDQEEALAICDRIAVMHSGRLEQVGTPEMVYTQPASRFVAEFVTGANFLVAKRRGSYWQTEIGEILATGSDQGWAEAEVMIRQEDISLIPNSQAGIVVRERQFLGREYRYCLETASGKRLHALTSFNTAIDLDEQVEIVVSPEKIKLFPLAAAQSTIMLSA